MDAQGFVLDDGGRAVAGFKGSAGDCVARSIAIVAQRPYAEVYERLARETGSQRAGKRGKRAASARAGINTTRKWFKDYMRSLGFVWTPTMQIGSGCKVHLCAAELPAGRLVVAVSKHMTAVLDGVIHDTHDPRREGGEVTHWYKGNTLTHSTVSGGRCVYGFWKLTEVPA